MAVKNANKVVINGEIVLDLTGDSVTADKLAKGYTAHDKSGAVITGTMTASGGEPVRAKDVNFIDYDGTIRYSYTLDEVAALTALPALPTHDGLTCQGWNRTLDDIKAMGRAVDVGAMYVTDDGKTRLYIRIATDGRMTLPLYFSQTVANGVTIDWGDGTATDTVAGTGNVNTSHTYAAIGDYMIALSPADGCILGLGSGSKSNSVLGNQYVYKNMLQRVEVGNSVTPIGTYAFYHCYSLASVVIPSGVTSIGGGTFYNCYSLASIVIPSGVTSIDMSTFYQCYSLASAVIPSGVTSIGDGAFYQCYSLASIVIPSGVTSIGMSTFYNCYSLASVVIPSSVTSIGTYAFYHCTGVAYYDFTSAISVPTLRGTNAFTSIPSDCQIRVPAALAGKWKAATNWSTYADHIVGV